MSLIDDRRVNFLRKLCLITICFQVISLFFYVSMPLGVQLALSVSIPATVVALVLLDKFSRYREAIFVFLFSVFFQHAFAFYLLTTNTQLNIGAAFTMGSLIVVSGVMIGQRWALVITGLTLLVVVIEMYFNLYTIDRVIYGNLIQQKSLYSLISILQPAILVNYFGYYFYHALAQEERDKKEIKFRLAEILTNSLQSVVLIGRDHEIVYADTKSKDIFKNYFGTNLEEGQKCHVIAPKYLVDAFMQNLGRAFEGEKIVRERKIQFSETHSLWFLVMYAPLYDSYGNIDAVQFSLLDISVQKNVQEELQKAEEQWKYALNSSLDGVWDWSVKDGKAYFSKMWKEMLGYDESEINDSWAEWERLVHPEDKQRSFEEILKHVKNQTENYILEHRLLLKNGGYKWILARGKIIERDVHGNPVRFIGTHTDIDHIKKVEQDLKGAQARAEQAAEAKSLFLSTISHEIRTPLNAVIGFSNLLMRETAESQNSEYLQNIQTSANHLLSLVNNVLDISKIESGKVEFEKREFELEKIIDENISMLSLRAMEKAISLRIGKIPALSYTIVGDPFRLTQVLNNLLGNAVKFTSKGYVQMDVELIEDRAAELELKFSISDTGAGIPKNKIETIFESFSQASTDTARKYGGTGLGLTISKHLVNLQGGDIYVESKLNEGSTFFFQLVFGKGQKIKKSAKPVDEKEESLAGLRALVVEDNIFNTKVLTRFLDIWKVEYSVAENGQEAIEKIKEKDFDLILMDLHMPIMDGYEATRNIRESGNSIHIMALTASGNFNSSGEMKQKGFDDYSVKPINTKELYKKLKEVRSGILEGLMGRG